jgi:teichuronic acid biosynthesis glycosyltransferase TuaC
MRVLVITKIFPNAREPHACPFNLRQFAALAELCEVEVLATIPWFPGAEHFARWSRAGRLSDVPDSECIDGLNVSHPRFAYVPKIGVAFSGPLYAASLAPRVLAHRGRVDIVLGSWAYPDGYAAIALAPRLGVPVVVKVHGSDINVLARRAVVRRHLRQAMPKADRVVTVSKPLAERVATLGVRADRIDVVPNGVDRSIFFPTERGVARAELGLEPGRKLVLFVGRVEREKGAIDLVRAMASVPASLAMIGDGGAMASCRELARQLGVSLRSPGARPHAEVARWIAAADVVTLPSWNEGTPNSVLEALACGRRVVATNVGGIPDVLSASDSGELVPPHEPERLAAGLRRALASSDPATSDIPSWRRSAELLYASLTRAIADPVRKAA